MASTQVLAAWLFYTLNRRRKKERYTLAMERYRSRLLTLGVAQWIKVASAVRAQRSEVALQQQAKSARCVWQCVRRCALHWRRVTRDRKRERVVVADRPEGPAGTRGARRETDMPVCTEGKLQISDRMSHVRPQPRKPDFLRQLATQPSHTSPSETLEVDTVPRVFAPLPPPSPPILYSSKRDTSFTFLPSTCSGETSTLTKPNLRGSPLPKDSKPPPSHQEHHGLPTDTTTLGTTAQRQTHMQFETHNSEPHPLLLPSAPKEVRPDCDMPMNLNDPTVQSEIIHMRNELKRYHDLRVKQSYPEGEKKIAVDLYPSRKTRHRAIKNTEAVHIESRGDQALNLDLKSGTRLSESREIWKSISDDPRLLEEQVSQAIEGDAHEHATELQRELASAVEVVQAYEPRIRTVATRISQLLSQC